MSLPAFVPRLVAALLALTPLTSPLVEVPLGKPAAPVAVEPGDRTLELLRYSCANPLGHREVTLFANGTVRLFDGPPGKEWMGLTELDPDSLSGAVNRLAAENLQDADDLPPGVEGTWIEQCTLALALPPAAKKVYRFGRYDTLPLSLSKIVRLAEELSTQVLALKEKEELPVGYEPRIGDVLKRVDGRHFRVEGFTSDGKGVELGCVDDPLGLYVAKDQFGREFVAVISRPK